MIPFINKVFIESLFEIKSQVLDKLVNRFSLKITSEPYYKEQLYGQDGWNWRKFTA